MPFYRCNVCDVISRDLIEHNRHLEGKRHARNVAVATGQCAPPPALDGAPSAKRRRRAERETASVAAASTLLNPALATPPTFLHLLLNEPLPLSRATDPTIADALLPLPDTFSDHTAYLAAWRPFLLEECRAALAQGSPPDWEHAACEAVTRSLTPPPLVGRHAGLPDPCTLQLSLRGAVPGGPLREGTAVALRLAGEPVARLGYVLRGGGADRGDVEVAVVLPDAPGRLPAYRAGVWALSALGSLLSQRRMFDACLSPLLDEGPVAADLLRGRRASPPPPIAPPPGGRSAALAAGLNDAQQRAVVLGLDGPAGIHLVQGPPGTGKTTAILSFLAEHCRRGRGRVLVCAPSNKAVQELCLRFSAAHPDVPTVLVSADDELEAAAPPALLALSLHHWWEVRCAKCLAGDAATVDHVWDEIQRRAPQFSAAQRGAAGVSPAARCSALQAALADAAGRQAAEAEVLGTTTVVCCTLAVAGRPTLREALRAATLVVDEAAQCVEPEVLVGIAAAQPSRCLLVGDPQQLPATVLSRAAVRGGFARSLMERLMACSHPSVLLTVQYRMHPHITQLPNSLFYGGALEDAASVQGGHRHCDWYAHAPALGPLAFLDVAAAAEEVVGRSFQNQGEAALVAAIVRHLVRGCGVPAAEIGVLTFYSGQVGLLRAHLPGLPGLKVATVDGFQGSERQVVVLSFVRCGGMVGFLQDFRRLNVAITRAKNALIMVGNASTLSQDTEGSLGLMLRMLQALGLVHSEAVARQALR